MNIYSIYIYEIYIMKNIHEIKSYKIDMFLIYNLYQIYIIIIFRFLQVP